MSASSNVGDIAAACFEGGEQGLAAAAAAAAAVAAEPPPATSRPPLEPGAEGGGDLFGFDETERWDEDSWDEDEDGPWEAEGPGAPEGLQAQAAKTAGTAAGGRAAFLAGSAPLQGGTQGEKLPREDEEAATEEEEGARVARELATHSAADSVAFLAHCEQMLAQKQAWGCCSSRMVSELRKKVAVDALGGLSTATIS